MNSRNVFTLGSFRNYCTRPLCDPARIILTHYCLNFLKYISLVMVNQSMGAIRITEIQICIGRQSPTAKTNSMSINVMNLGNSGSESYFLCKALMGSFINTPWKIYNLLSMREGYHD